MKLCQLWTVWPLQSSFMLISTIRPKNTGSHWKVVVRSSIHSSSDFLSERQRYRGCQRASTTLTQPRRRGVTAEEVGVLLPRGHEDGRRRRGESSERPQDPDVGILLQLVPTTDFHRRTKPTSPHSQFVRRPEEVTETSRKDRCHPGKLDNFTSVNILYCICKTK